MAQCLAQYICCAYQENGNTFACRVTRRHKGALASTDLRNDFYDIPAIPVQQTAASLLDHRRSRLTLPLGRAAGGSPERGHVLAPPSAVHGAGLWRGALREPRHPSGQLLSDGGRHLHLPQRLPDGQTRAHHHTTAASGAMRRQSEARNVKQTRGRGDAAHKAKVE